MKIIRLFQVGGLLLLGAASSVLAVDTTNILSGAFTSNVLAVSSSTGNSKLVVCDPDSSFTVITQLTVSANGGAATFFMNGSTGIVQDSGSSVGGTGWEIYLSAAGTGAISLVNSSLTITNNNANRNITINSTELGILNLSNSTLQTRGTAVTGGLMVGGAGKTNLLQMYYSTLDLNNSSLILGGGATYVGADIQNSIITNIFNLWVGGQGSGGDSASRVSVVISNSSFTGVGAGQAGSYNIGSTKGTTLTLDHSTMDCPNSRPTFDIGYAVGSTGTFNIVNGSAAILRGDSSSSRPIRVGTSGVGTMNISNATVSLKVGAAFGSDSLDLELGVNATGVGAVNVYNGTNFVDTSLIVGKSGNGAYSADGNSLVQVAARTLAPIVGNVIIGQNAGSTGTFTLAGSSFLIVTNSAATNALIVGQGGNGAFIQNGGTVRTDRLFVTNGVNSIYTFNGGVLMAKAATNNNGFVFTVGNGSSEATLALLTGSHRFASGVTLAASGVLATGGTNALGTVSINGDVTLQSGAVLDCDFTASTNDWTQITGTLTLPATASLRVRTLDASLRTPITVMQATTISGDVTGWGLTTVNGLQYRAVVNGNLLQLETVAATNDFYGAVCTNQIAVIASVDIWHPGSSFNVTTNIVVSSLGGTATLLMYGSTGVVQDSGATISSIDLGTSGTGTVSLVNSSLTITNNNANRNITLNSTGLGVLNLSNSTLQTRGTATSGGMIIGGAGNTNLLQLYFSTLDLNNQDLTVGGGGAYAGADIQDSVITNVSNLKVGSGATGQASMVLSNSSYTGIGDVIIGQNSGSTGTVTLAGSSLLMATNTSVSSSLVVGQGGKGTFIQNGGAVTVDKLIITNGANSVYTFNGGVLTTSAATNSNGSVFTVGNGSTSATLALLTGSHRFANGVTIAANGVLATGGTNALGTAFINGNVTLQTGAVLDCDFTASTNDWTQITGTLALPATATLRIRSLDASQRTPITVMQATTISGDITGWAPVAVNGHNYRAVVSGSLLQLHDVVTTYNYYGAVSTNALTVSSSTGNGRVDIWNPGSSFTVITNIAVSANGGAATFLMNGSTGIVQDTSSQLPISIASAGTGTISLINSSLMVTNITANRNMTINSTGLGILSLSNSTIQTRGTATTGGMIIGGAGNTNLLLMYYSTLDLNNSSLTFGMGGTYVGADIQNSIITNIFNFWVGGQGATTPDSASMVSVVISNSSFTGVGGGQAGCYNIGSTKGATLTLDHSTMDSPNSRPYFDIGYAVGSTGTFNIVNGSAAILRGDSTLGSPNGRSIRVGTSGVGTMNISNSTVSLKVGASFAPDALNLELGENATGVGAVNVYNGTHFVDTSLVVGRSGNGSYSADGSSLVQMAARTLAPIIGDVILAQNAGSTGTFTLAGSSLLLATNSAASSTLVVGQGGKGTFVQNGGMVKVDKLIVTNGVNSIYTFNGGVLMAKAATNNNGSVFAVGNGSSEATLALLTGSHRFANGVTFASNGVLATGGTNALGTVSIHGDVTLQPGAVLDCDYTVSTNDWTQITGTLTLPATGTLRVRSLDASLRTPITVMQATWISGNISGWGLAAVNDRQYRAVVNGNLLQLEMAPCGSVFAIR